MNALSGFVVVLASLVLTACGGVPVKQGATASVASADTCPPAFDKDAVMKYGYPDAWRREYREPPTVWALYKCSKLQPLIEWAKSASNYESERGGCTGGHTSFRCESYRGPSGTSSRGSRWRSEGTYLELAIAVRTMPSCTDAASVRRYLYVDVDQDGRWKFRAESECYR